MEKPTEEKLSARKKMAVWLLLLIVKIIEPTNFTHEYSKELDEVRALIKDI